MSAHREVLLSVDTLSFPRGDRVGARRRAVRVAPSSLQRRPPRSTGGLLIARAAVCFHGRGAPRSKDKPWSRLPPRRPGTGRSCGSRPGPVRVPAMVISQSASQHGHLAVGSPAPAGRRRRCVRRVRLAQPRPSHASAGAHLVNRLAVGPPKPWTAADRRLRSTWVVLPRGTLLRRSVACRHRPDRYRHSPSRALVAGGSTGTSGPSGCRSSRAGIRSHWSRPGAPGQRAAAEGAEVGPAALGVSAGASPGADRCLMRGARAPDVPVADSLLRSRAG